MQKTIFVVGDSISLYYHKYLKHNLENLAVYYRKGNEEEIERALTPGVPLEELWKANGGTSTRVLEYLKEKTKNCLKNKKSTNPQKLDLILFNCGLHDIKTMGTSEKRQVNLSKYAHNLKKIVSLVKKLQKNGLNEKLFWINTTPVDNNRHNSVRNKNFRYNEDVLKYNKIAEDIMKKNNIQIIDLYTFTKNILEKDNDCFRDELHYNDNVSKQQADYITKQIKPYLK